MTSHSLLSLPPAQRAELIYRAARVGLDAQLWQAALGRAGESAAGRGTAATPGQGLLRLDSLVEALAADDMAAPRLAGTSPPSAPAVLPAGDNLDLGPNAAFAPAIARASSRAGLSPALLAAIVDAEAAKLPDGRWNPASRNPRSSASGLGQFLTGTWLGEVRRQGSWLQREASDRGWLTPAGTLREGARAAFLALRFDPEAAIQATADHAAANLQRLRASGIRPQGPAGEARAAYLAHHLGLGDALRFLGSGLSDARASRLLAAQVGSAAAERRIAQSGGAAEAHRAWLTGYIDRRIQPSRFVAA